MRGAGPGGAGPRGRSRSRAGAAAAAAPSMVMAEPRRPPPALLPLPRGAVAVRVGFYDIEGTLGKGNFAVVKLARHRITRSEVSGDPPRCPPGAPLGVPPGGPGPLTVPHGDGSQPYPPRPAAPRPGEGAPGGPGLGAPRARCPSWGSVPSGAVVRPPEPWRGTGEAAAGVAPRPRCCAGKGCPQCPAPGGRGWGANKTPKSRFFEVSNGKTPARSRLPGAEVVSSLLAAIKNAPGLDF